MAEWSKAPDSRKLAFIEGPGRSGPHLRAWVRIPHLTNTFYLIITIKILWIYISAYLIDQYRKRTCDICLISRVNRVQVIYFTISIFPFTAGLEFIIWRIIFLLGLIFTLDEDFSHIITIEMVRILQLHHLLTSI